MACRTVSWCRAEGGGDGADAPVLGVEEAPDLGVLRRGDHGRPSAPRRAGPHVDERGVPDEAAAATTAGAAERTGDWLMAKLDMRHGLLGVARARGRWRRRRQDAGGVARRGSLMRHFLAAGPIAALPSGVLQAAAPAVLIAAPGGAPRRAPRLLGTAPGAVAIAAITVAAEEEDLAALGASADHEPERIHASLRTGRRGGQSRPSVRSQRRAGSRVPMWDSARGPGVATPGPHPQPRRQDRSTVSSAVRQPLSCPLQISALFDGHQQRPTRRDRCTGPSAARRSRTPPARR